VSAAEKTAIAAVGLALDGAAAAAMEGRVGIFEMTAVAEAAVLRPADPGGVPRALRAALAARIAGRSGDPSLARHYGAGAGALAPLADPAMTGAACDALGVGDLGAPLSMVVAFVDRVAQRPRDVVADDVASLRAAGVSDADIVRLCELVAFVAYQSRVVAGLRLMDAAP
jgi:uncharacterized protein YciW